MTLNKAVVLGASVSGLLAAAALSSSFESVTIIERDELSDEPVTRRGVPQGDQIHLLLPLGMEKIEALLPGFEQDLLTAGGEKYDMTAATAYWTPCGWSARARSGIDGIGFLRPTFEWLLRRRVLAAGNVSVLRGTARGLLSDASKQRVTGVKLADGDSVSGDLVVDATGRGSKAHLWVEDLGYPRPETQHLRAFQGYTTMTVRLPDDALPSDLRAVVVPPHPGNPRGGAVVPCGDGNHVVAACGMTGDYPPVELAELLDFLDQASSPLLGSTVRAGTVLTPPTSYKMAGSQRRLWEKLERRPEGFVVIGDAVASFNPLYGQGMTMSALGATVLKQAVEAANGQIDGVADTVARDLTPWVDIAFSMAASQDAFYEGAEFVNVDPLPASVAETNALLATVATEDVDVMLALRKAAYYMDQSDLMSEQIQAKVAAWAAEGRTPSAAATDPKKFPEIVSASV